MKSPYNPLYNLIFIVHPPSPEVPFWSLELDVSRLTGALAFLWAVFVSAMFGSGAWSPGISIIVAILTFLAGILGLVFLGSLPLDKMRIAAESKVPADLAASVGKLMPLDKTPERNPEDKRA